MQIFMEEISISEMLFLNPLFNSHNHCCVAFLILSNLCDQGTGQQAQEWISKKGPKLAGEMPSQGVSTNKVQSSYCNRVAGNK